MLAEPGLATAAKIIIYEFGKGSFNGPSPAIDNGIYILIRVPGGAIANTFALAPHHDERFAYFRLMESQNLEEMADFIAACTQPDACVNRFKQPLNTLRPGLVPGRARAFSLIL